METRMLVVDDEIFVRELLAEFFTKINFHVQTAKSGEDALRLLETERFDVALIDLKMPGSSGIELLRAIREKERDLRVIMMSGYPTVDSVIGAMREGASDFAIKPFRLKELQGVVTKAFAGRPQREDVTALREKIAELEASIALLRKQQSQDSLKIGQRRLAAIQAEPFDGDESILIGTPRRRVRPMPLTDDLYKEENHKDRMAREDASSILEQAR